MENEVKNIKKTKKVNGKELAWYIGASIFILGGLTFLVFSIIGYTLNVKPSENWVKISESTAWRSWSNMGWMEWGLILFGFGMIILIATLAYNAKKTDKEVDKANRRKQRLASLEEMDKVEEKPSVEIIESNEGTTK